MVELIKIVMLFVFDGGLILFLFLWINGPLLRRKNIMEFVGNLRLASTQSPSLFEGLASICSSGDREINSYTVRFYNQLKSNLHPRDILHKSSRGWGVLPASMAGLLASAWGKISDEKLVNLLHGQAVGSWSAFSSRYHRKHINFLPVFMLGSGLALFSITFAVFTMPKFIEILGELAQGSESPGNPMLLLTPYSRAFLDFQYGHSNVKIFLILMIVMLCIFCTLYMLARNILHVIAEPVSRFFEQCADRIIPLRHAVIEKDFIMVLAACLDSGLNEKESIETACDSMNNKLWKNNKNRMLKAMADGTGLCDALDKVLRDRSLKWRMRNLLLSGSDRNLAVSLEPWAEMVSQKAAAFISVALDLTLVILILMVGFFIGSFSWVIFDILMAGIRITGM